MRVLFLTGEFPPQQGGVGDCTNEIARALARCGVEAHVLTNAADPEVADQAGGITVHRLVPEWDWRILPLLVRIMGEIQPDILHIQYQTAAFGMHPAVNLAPRLLRSRLPSLRARQSLPRGAGVSLPRIVTTFHDLKVPYLFPKAGPVRDWITFELARASDAVVATNEEDHARLLAHTPSVTLIPIGSNIAPAPPAAYDCAAWRARLGVAPDDLLLSYFGFLNESKGGETLIRALALVPRARLLMVGGQVGSSDPTNVSYLARVQQLAAELAPGRVIWTDFSPPQEVSAGLLASDIGVLPYRDGASFRRGSLMAALAHGLAVVTTAPASAGPAAPSTLPSLSDGDNVLLVPPDDPSALASAIGRLASDPALRARLSRGALDLAQHFTWDKIARGHLALYEQLTAASARKSS